MQLDIYFYDYPCWEGRVLRHITGSRFTHVVPGVGDAGYHIDPRISRWVSLKSLHRVMPYHTHLSVPIRTYPVQLIEDLVEGMSIDLVDLASWYRNREQGLIRPMPDSCVEATRLMLLACGVSVEQGTPDELYTELLQDPAVSAHLRGAG